MTKTMSCCFRWLLPAVVVIATAFPTAALAQRSDEQVDRPERSAAGRRGQEGFDQRGPRSPRDRERRMNPRDSRQLVDALRQLRESMAKKLVFDSKQKEAIDVLFEDHLDSIKESAGEGLDEQQAQQRERFEELRKRMEAARQNGDREELKRLREESRKLRKELAPLDMQATAGFIKELEKVLSDEQRPVFKKMVRRLGLAGEPSRRGPGGRFRMMMAALQDPDLGITDEKVQQIREMVRERMSSVARDEAGRGDREKVLEELEGLILAELTTEQRSKLEAKMKDLGEREQKRRPRGERRSRGASDDVPSVEADGDETEDDGVETVPDE